MVKLELSEFMISASCSPIRIRLIDAGKLVPVIVIISPPFRIIICLLKK